VIVIFLKTNHSRWNNSRAWIRHKKDRPVHCQEGTWGEEFYMVKPLDDEPIVVKHRFSGFIGTDFDHLLRIQGIQTLIMTGGGTHACVESTARDGFMLDYDIVLLSDCTFTSSPKRHYTALEVMGELFATVVSSKEVVNAWVENADPDTRLEVGSFSK
jgi:ureidoacrylate peracid hydrolase